MTSPRAAYVSPAVPASAIARGCLDAVDVIRTPPDRETAASTVDDADDDRPIFVIGDPGWLRAVAAAAAASPSRSRALAWVDPARGRVDAAGLQRALSASTRPLPLLRVDALAAPAPLFGSTLSLGALASEGRLSGAALLRDDPSARGWELALDAGPATHPWGAQITASADGRLDAARVEPGLRGGLMGALLGVDALVAASPHDAATTATASGDAPALLDGLRVRLGARARITIDLGTAVRTTEPIEPTRRVTRPI